MTQTIVTEPVIPPIPNVPLVDRDGRCTREWWRWFNQVFQVALAQQGQIDIGSILPSIPQDAVISVPIDILSVLGTVVSGASEAQLIDLAVSAALTVPPPDPVQPDQVVMQALSLGVMA